MGVLTTDGVSSALAGRLYLKSADLTNPQLKSLDDKKKKFLDMHKDCMDKSIPEEEMKICRNLSCIESEVFHSYLPHLESAYEPLYIVNEFSPKLERISSFDITKWVIDHTEDSIEKLCSVYQVLSDEECSIALIYERNQAACHVKLAVSNNRTEQDDPSVARSFSNRLKDALKGNFPGIVCSDNRVDTLLLDEMGGASVAVITNLASEKSKQFISQSMEKLLDGIVPQSEEKSYAIVLLATPIRDTAPYTQNLYDKYTAISPFAHVQKQMSISDSASVMFNANVGGNIGLHTKVGAMANIQLGHSAGSTDATTVSNTNTLTYVNYEVKHCMDMLEQQMKRIEQCKAFGMWNFATYVFSNDYSTTQNVAHMYNSLTQGDQSFIEQAAINTWGLPKGTEDTANYIYRNILGLQHPVFCLKNDGNDYYPNLVDATTIVSGDELAHAMNFPRKSVSGLPVYECVPFGREVVLHTADKPEGHDTIPLGNIYHMRTEEKNTPVNLQKDSLTAHTFITGSTGAGKSNAVYTMLNGLCPASNGDEGKSHAHFLVIEPAKGEYKDVFGGRGDVSVYGTNPKKTPLLRLNPFSFPEDTHILEHIDRLVEVFNACWPMYAAMPAVLKASIETAYTDCSWDLQMSEYVGKQRSFPTFRDVMKALPKVVDAKGFSNDTQGDYKGALLTRLESLTNGINGQVLCAADEIAGQELFDKNVIVDLSRVGSSETKALLMGILVLKLQEYRMAERAENGAADNNKGLHHVTVLEEAHNLLRRTSTEQSQEGSNLQGKSVEMLTNAIAEMRTYGEGFIIADQAPGLLDMAVIRNTNTKIILRLPDESDRVLVSKAAGLNDDQIVELSRLDTGVAAVYQNHWLEPVLCKVAEFKKEQQKPFVYKPTDADTIQNSTSCMNVLFGRIVKTDPTIGELNDEDVDRLKNWIDNLPVGRNTKLQLLNVLNPEGKLDDLNKGEILYRLTNGNDFLKYAGTKADREAACTVIDQKIMQQLDISRQLAEEVRREIFLYAASQIDRERLAAQYVELQQYAELPQRGVR